MRIAIYSQSCQNHHQGFTKGCQGNEDGSNTDWGLSGVWREVEWVGEPQLSLPHLMPQKRVLLWPAPLPIPQVQFFSGGGGLGTQEEGVCSVSGPQEGEGNWGKGPPFSHALTTLISQGTDIGEAS